MAGDSVSPRIAVIGAGRLGRTVLRTFPELVRLVVARRVDEIRRLNVLRSDAAIIPELTATPEFSPEVVWIAVPDRMLEEVAVTARGVFGGGDVIFLHSSGSRGVDVFSRLQSPPRSVALHPNAILSGDDAFASDLVWGVERLEVEESWVRELLFRVNPKLVSVPSEQRSLYHAAATLAANYPLTLHALAVRAYLEVGINADAARLLTDSLMQQSISNASKHGLLKGLTGPVARGDVETVSRNLEAFARAVPDHERLLRELIASTAALLPGSSERDQILEIIASRRKGDR